MKKGDIVIMPGETIIKGSPMSVGIIMNDAPDDGNGSLKRRVDVLWLDAEGQVESEPRAWLQVVGHISSWGVATRNVQSFSS